MRRPVRLKWERATALAACQHDADFDVAFCPVTTEPAIEAAFFADETTQDDLASMQLDGIDYRELP